MTQEYLKDLILTAVENAVDTVIPNSRDILGVYSKCGVIVLATDENFRLADVDKALKAIKEHARLPCDFRQLRVVHGPHYDFGFAVICIPQCIEDASQFPDEYRDIITAFTDANGDRNHWEEFPFECCECSFNNICPFSDYIPSHKDKHDAAH